MDKKILSLFNFSKIDVIEPVNEEFDLCKVYVQGVGKNRNFSYMSKENIDKALPTLSYVPVVGHLIEKFDEDGNSIGYYFGGHDYTITKDLQMKSICVPFGVVIADSFDYETVDEFGTEVEYLTAKAVLWTGRYPELKEAIYSDDCWFNQSMEISVGQYRPLEEDSNYTEILSWNYSALCILGKSDNPDEHTEPCFISSKFVPLSYGFNENNFTKAMFEMKELLKGFFKDGDITKEGGNAFMTDERIAEILAQYKISKEDLKFEITSEMTEEDFIAKLDEFKDEPKDDDSNKDGEDKGAEPSVEPEEPTAEPEVVVSADNEKYALFSTYKEKYNALRNAIDNDVVYDANGNIIEETWYYVSDFDDTYAYVERNHWIKDDYNCDNGRFAYTYDEATNTATVTGEFEQMFLVWMTAQEKEKLENERAEYSELKEFKNETLKAQKKSEYDNVIEEFTDLNGIDEFEKLKDENTLYSFANSDELKKECFAIRGMHQVVKKENKNKFAKAKVQTFSKDNDSNYVDDFFAKYGSNK